MYVHNVGLAVHTYGTKHTHPPHCENIFNLSYYYLISGKMNGRTIGCIMWGECDTDSNVMGNQSEIVTTTTTAIY